MRPPSPTTHFFFLPPYPPATDEDETRSVSRAMPARGGTGGTGRPPREAFGYRDMCLHGAPAATRMRDVTPFTEWLSLQVRWLCPLLCARMA
jgi:hypothetical protein